eukprot:6212096-Pleurochrysis_carterae.AAC.6
MNVRGAGGCVDVGSGEEIGELGGEEFSGVVGVERTDEALRHVRTAVGESSERSDEFADAGGSLGFSAHR